MPEIKHTFTGGKMDKDLDERLVKNGEYRDAMNIQVATSEGSDVATAQNILGNKIATTGFIIDGQLESVDFGASATVVAAVADEINDKLYYLVYSQNVDYIIEYDNQNIGRFVIIDVKSTSGGILKFDPNNIITGINIVDGMIFFTDNINEPKKINIERCKAGSTGLGMTKLINEKANITLTDNINLEEKHITVIKKAPTMAPSMRLLTGREEGLNYTAVFSISDASNLQLSDIVEVDLDNDGTVDTNPPDLSGIQGGDLVTIEINNYLDSSGNVQTGGLSDITGFSTGKKVVIKSFDENNPTSGAPNLPITDFDLKGEIISISSNVIDILISSVDGFPPPVPQGSTQLYYAIDLFQEEEKLFEFKFPRFAYRYKFEDGEYSPFSPFTQVAFAAGSFDYHPRKGYNLGMTNRLTSVLLNNMVNKKTPKDVVQVDILFKEEPSPNIYVVESIKPSDDVEAGSTINTWDRLIGNINEYYEIKREAVKSVVPSNQLLRPWDNVPRKALAQEVTASRLIYGNYVQNYDLINNNGSDYVPKLVVSNSNRLLRYNFEETYGSTKKSVKSLREYQVGVVFGDEYGRETPVLSNTTGLFNIEKADCNRNNQIKVQFSSVDFPVNLKQFKFFVKETSTEYYNLAMDRYYDAEDDNIWLAFPSSDRNKIDLDTFLILKKKSDGNEVVKDAARYKILAIENQAPDHIKTKKTIISRVSNSNNQLFASGTTNAPIVTRKEFKMFYAPFFGTPGQNLNTIFNDQLYVEFALGDQVSDRYRIASITTDFDKDATGVGQSNITTAKYSVRLDKTLKDDVNFITNDPTGNNIQNIETGAIINIYKYAVENRPQFDGRFFAKIYYDEVFRKNVVNQALANTQTFSVISSKKLFAMRSDHIQRHTADANRFYLADKNTADYSHGTIGEYFPIISQTTGSSTQLYDASRNFGYYHIDAFASFAMFFRRYKAGEQSLGGGNTWPFILNLGTGGSGDNVIEYKESHGVSDFWKYAGNKVETTSSQPGHEQWGEFGYSPLNGDGADNDFTKFHSLTRGWYGSPLASSYSKPREASDNVIDLVLKPDRAVARDTEVWFIDAGPFTDTVNDLTIDWGSGSGVSGARNWQQHFNNIFENPQFSTTGGITHAGNGIFNMELSYGGIAIETDDLPDRVDGNNGPGGNKYFMENHFAIGDWNTASSYTPHSFYNNNEIKSVTNNLAVGTKFRFKEDFNKTVYVINGTIQERGRLRHSARLSYGSGIDTHISMDGSSGSNPNHAKSSFAETLSFNFTKNWRIGNIEPFDSNVGVNHFGRKILQYGEISSTYGGTRIQLTICSNNGSTTTGVTCEGQDIHDDLKIFVTSLQGSNTTFSLLEGMAIREYTTNDDDTGSPDDNTHNGSGANDYLVVRKINKITQGGNEFFELILGGYKKPLIQSEHDAMTSSNKSPKINTTITFCQVGMNGYSHNSEFNINTIAREFDIDDCGAIGAVGYTIEFLTELLAESEDILSDNPAIWETEPKETKDLDIYYEATGAIPLVINKDNIHDAFPVGSVVEQGNNFYTVINHVNDTLKLDSNFTPSTPVNVKINRPDGLTIKVEVTDKNSDIIELNPTAFKHQFYLPYFNCYSFGNGVESNRIRDNFNLPFISNGVKVSTVLEGDYEEERRKYGLIYSGIYNSISGVNNLNQFIQGEKITKDVNPIYGSIQKLHTRDSDLIALCEDKILKILAQKDALFNADGNTNVTATSNVLGQTIPFGGEYGISKNPESFASEDYRIYFSDKVRGSVMRLSRDGLTPISDAGMKDWFRDHLKLTTKVIGSYDDKKGEYNIKLKMSGSSAVNPNNIIDKVVSFSEKVRGWVSFKSFIDMEFGISMANNYYTFKEGQVYLHHFEEADRNTFYGDFEESSIEVMLNDDPSSIKIYNTLNYEGSQAHIDKFTRQVVDFDFYPSTIFHDQNFYNLYEKEGWYVESIITDKEEGSVNEFKEKEGKWFNSVNRKIDITVDKIDTGDFSFQGVGVVSSVQTVDTSIGPIDDTAAGIGISIVDGPVDPPAPLILPPVISDIPQIQTETITDDFSDEDNIVVLDEVIIGTPPIVEEDVELNKDVEQEELARRKKLEEELARRKKLEEELARRTVRPTRSTGPTTRTGY